MATLNVIQITRASVLDAVVAATTTGDEFANDGRVFLEIFNDHASASRTVTITIQASIDGQTPDGIDVTVAAGAARFVGPFPPRWYNNVNGRVEVTYSDGGADTYVGAFRL